MTAEDLRAILTPIRNQWLPMIESEPDPLLREGYFRAAMGQAFLAGQRHEIHYREAHTVSEVSR